MIQMWTKTERTELEIVDCIEEIQNNRELAISYEAKDSKEAEIALVSNT